MNSTSPIKVAIVHPDALVRACLASALSQTVDIELGAAVADADEMEAVPDPVDVIVSDYASGVALAASPPTRELAVPVLVVSGADREWDLRNALANRVKGYLVPNFELDQLMDGVRAVRRGSRYLCSRSSTRLAESLSFETLTEREAEVLSLVVQGYPNKQISREMGISIGTVKSHIKSAYGKMRVASRSLAIAAIQRRGLLRPDMRAEPRSHHFARDLPFPSQIQRASVGGSQALDQTAST